MTNAVYQNVASPITWKDSGGSFAITMSSLAAQAGRIGARGDLGAWPKPRRFRWMVQTAWASNPVAGETLDFYLSLWDNDTGPADPWGTVSASDSALTSTQRSNLQYIGSVTAETAGTGVFEYGGVINIDARYISPVLFNNSAAKALAAVGTTPTILRLTPLFDEIQ